MFFKEIITVYSKILLSTVHLLSFVYLLIIFLLCPWSPEWSFIYIFTLMLSEESDSHLLMHIHVTVA